MCFSWSNLYENKNPPLLKLNKCFLFLEVVNIVFLLTKINAVGNSSFFQQYYRNLNEFQLFYNLQTSVIIEERGLHQTSSRNVPVKKTCHVGGEVGSIFDSETAV